MLCKRIKNKIYLYNQDDNKIVINSSKKGSPKKLKIGIIMDTVFSIPPTNGFTWRLYFLSQKLTELGCQVVWFLGNRNFKNEEEVRKFNNPNVKTYVIPPKNFYNVKFLNRLIEKEGVDILQYEITQTFLSLGVPLKMINKIPTVLEIHDVEAVLRESLNRKKEVDFMEFLQFIAGQEADAIVAFTQMDKKLLIEKINIPDYKISIAPIAISKEYSSQPYSRRKNVLLFLGNIFYPPNKEAVIFLIEKVLPIINKKVGDVKLKVVGGIPASLIKKYKNRKDIIFTGEISDLNAFQEEISSSAVGLCTVFSGSGMKVKILNYCACGLPVVATPIGLSGYENIGSLICVKPEAENIAECLSGLLKDGVSACNLGKKNRNAIFREFSWDKTGKELIKIYRHLVNRNQKQLDIPKPFWLTEKRDKKVVLPDCWLVDNFKIKKIKYEE